MIKERLEKEKKSTMSFSDTERVGIKKMHEGDRDSQVEI